MEQIVREDDPENLRQLVMNINVLLNPTSAVLCSVKLIEEQLAKLEGRQPPQRH
jgi:hypothetical protein